MKRYGIIFGLLLLAFHSMAQPEVVGKQLQVDLNFLRFHLPGDTSYIELQYLVHGNTLTYRPNNKGEYQGSVIASVTLQSTTKPDYRINKEVRFVTGSYPVCPSEEESENHYFLTRLPLPADSYRMSLTIRDENGGKTASPLHFSAQIDLRFDRQHVCASDIQRIASCTQSDSASYFSKNGLQIIPYFSEYYPEEVENLTFMQEFYNTDQLVNQGEKCKIVTYITAEGHAEDVIPYKKIRFFPTTDKYVFLWNFNLQELPSGNFYLHVNLYGPDNRTLHRDSLLVRRHNPTTDSRYSHTEYDRDSLSKDSLVQFIDYLTPIARADEVDFLRSAKKQDYQTLADFFYQFWMRRNPDDPWDAWFQYYRHVQWVNSKYSTLKLKGYRSDRGHYYLKYGIPDDIEYYPIDEGLYPYEIWRYYKLEDQTDVYFIFGNLDLATKEYNMICSNKKDERYDPRWKLRLKPKDKRPFSIEETE
ncbi:MAG: GWxTD domain-containing protein [Bacteroidales bacterium]|nr:GWxTD domain-containing protein [Bacteroidales bacterium]